MDASLASVRTDTPQAGFDLAIKLARMGVKYTQRSAEAPGCLRPAYADGAKALIASSPVIAINIQTIAAANDDRCVSRGGSGARPVESLDSSARL